MRVHVVVERLAAVDSLDHLACPFEAVAVRPAGTRLEEERNESSVVLEMAVSLNFWESGCCRSWALEVHDVRHKWQKQHDRSK